MSLSISSAMKLSLSPRGGNPFAVYDANGYAPEVVLDWSQNKAKGVQFSDLVHTRASNATQIASDGTVQWAPHNLALNSATPATQSITVASGADYTVEMTGSGSITLSGAGTGSVTEGNPVEITASTTSLTLTIVGSVDTMWAYRSDLGGMANSPATGNSYVPTTSAAVYLPRRENHIYSGGEWKKRVLIEPAATNLLTYSQAIAGVNWSGTNTTASDEGDGVAKIVLDNSQTSGDWRHGSTFAVTSGETCAVSIEAKAAEFGNFELDVSDGALGAASLKVDLSDGSISAAGAANIMHDIKDIGDGWYRVLFTASAVATTSTAFILRYKPGDHTGDGSSGYLVRHPQLEKSATPTSYIPTSGSTATRAADDYDADAAGIPFNTTGLSGALHGEISYGDEGAAGQETLFDRRVDVNNRITLTLDTDGAKTGTFTLTMVNGGSSASVSTTAELTPGVNKAFKVAWRVTDSDINIALDGTAETAVATAIGIPALGSTDMDIAPSGVVNLKHKTLFGADIADAGLEDAAA